MLKAFLILIFCRPFISSLAFPYINLIYSSALLAFLLIWIISNVDTRTEFPPRRCSRIYILHLRGGNRIVFPLAAFILSLLASILLSPNKTAGFIQLSNYVIAILIFLATASLSDNDKYRLICIVILSGFIISIMAAYQYFFGARHVIDYVARKGVTNPFILDYVSQKRIFFPFVTPNALAGYLIMALPLVLTIKGKEKWLIAAVIFFALLLTKSLGAILSLFLGLCLFYYHTFPLSPKCHIFTLSPRRGEKIVLSEAKEVRVRGESLKFIFPAAFAIIFLLVFLLRQAEVKQHLTPLFSLFMRLDYWRDTLSIIKAHPFVGVGLGNFNLAASRYAHNSYLQVWAETGIFGLASFLWLAWSALKKKGTVPEGDCPLFFPAVHLSCLAFLLHNLVDFTFFLPEVSLIWWALLGMACFFKPCAQSQ